MAYKVIILTEAETEIATAFSYLSERAPDAAAKWYRQVIAAMKSLAEMPTRCPLAPESEILGMELRQLLHGKRRSIYRIVFRILEESREVHVLTVRHGARKPLTDEEMQPFLDLP